MFLGAAMPTNIIAPDNRRHASVTFQVDSETHPDGSLRTPWWPRGAGFIGAMGTDVALLEGVWNEQPELTSGAQSRFGITGITRDQFGSPLGNCVVQLFRTSDDLIVAEVVSDPTGAYVITTPFFPDTHYLVAYRAGSPDVAGTTVNTLIAG